MDEGIYTLIKQRAQEASRLNGACKQGYHDLLKASNIGQLCRVLEKYWGDVLGMHRASTFEILGELYPKHREEFNRFGIFYNEGSAFGKVIVNNAEVTLGGEAKAWAYGTAKVQLKDRAACIAKEESEVTAFGQSHVQALDRASVFAYDRSTVNAAGEVRVTAYDASTVTAGDGAVVDAVSWNRILAVGSVKVTAPCSRKIKLLGKATLHIGKENEA